MWTGTRRIAIATAAAVVIGLALRTLQHSRWPTVHPRLAGPPILGAFALTYLLVAWAMGSGEAARWLRLARRRSRAERSESGDTR
jgi:hypothetical protein